MKHMVPIQRIRQASIQKKLITELQLASHWNPIQMSRNLYRSKSYLKDSTNYEPLEWYGNTAGLASHRDESSDRMKHVLRFALRIFTLLIFSTLVTWLLMISVWLIP